MSKNSPRSKNSGRKIRSSQMMKFLETKSTPSPRTKGCDKSEDKGGEDKGGEDIVRLEDKIDSQNDSGASLRYENFFANAQYQLDVC